MQHDAHLGLEVIVGELPEGEGLSGRVRQQAEGDADGVLRREACGVDKPTGRLETVDVTLTLTPRVREEFRDRRDVLTWCSGSAGCRGTGCRWAAC